MGAEQMECSWQPLHAIEPDVDGTGCQRLLAFLLNGWTITPLVSWQRLGIYRLAARIHDLKRDGWEIAVRTQSVQNRFGEKIQVAEYRLKNRGWE